MSSKRKSHRAKKRSDKRKAAVEVVREQLEAAGPSLVDKAPDETAGAAAPVAAAALKNEAVVPEDEHSVPPAGDLDTRFFSQPPSWPGPRLAAEDDPFPLAPHDRIARSLAPQAVARRALFARYVRGAVGVSLLLCASAVVKTALTSDDAPPPRRSAAASPWPPRDPPAAAAVVPGAAAEVPGASVETAPDAGDAAPPPEPPAALPAEGPGAAGSLRVR
jgi:hypothetical protein